MNNTSIPWHRRTFRWGQTNITEIDPIVYDIPFWREHWRRTRVQGVILNAGGIVAYYPSRFPLQHRAEHLGSRDLYGELTQAARGEGLAVLARMDSNRADENFYRAHPDWFAVDIEGKPRKAGEWYQACVNSPYYKEYLPEVLREIIERYQPDGFTDNSWTGLRRSAICYCEHCRRKFKEAGGGELPAAPDWNDPAYRQWIRWSYACRTENWDLNNRVTQEHGGRDCLWMGMVHADPVGSPTGFGDLKAIGERSAIIMCDHQSRDALGGFERNGLNGKLLHGISSWDIVIPESMAMYTRGEVTFRRTTNPPLEARQWMIEGIAGGISPWWHHVGAKQEDRRQFQTAEPVMRWHEANEEFLYNRQPIASVGLVWSQENNDFYGRDEPRERVGFPWRGWMHALTRARIPYLPVHADHIARDVGQHGLGLLILPDLAVMSEAQVAAVREFHRLGGNIIATGKTAALDEFGEPRTHGMLDDLLGVCATGRSQGLHGRHNPDWAVHASHNYLRLPDDASSRHAMVAGFEDTVLLPFGGTLREVEPLAGAQTIATYVPAFAIYPPEFSWMREERTNLPAIVVCDRGSGRTVYFAGDIDRCFGRAGHPDHRSLLTSAVRWAANDQFPITVRGPGYIDCHLYRQKERLLLHVVNLTATQAWPGYLEEHIAVGPLAITIPLPADCRPKGVRARCGSWPGAVAIHHDRVEIALEKVLDHELVVLE